MQYFQFCFIPSILNSVKGFFNLDVSPKSLLLKGRLFTTDLVVVVISFYPK